MEVVDVGHSCLNRDQVTDQEAQVLTGPNRLQVRLGDGDSKDARDLGPFDDGYPHPGAIGPLGGHRLSLHERTAGDACSDRLGIRQLLVAGVVG